LPEHHDPSLERIDCLGLQRVFGHVPAAEGTTQARLAVRRIRRSGCAESPGARRYYC
jgi:hypothetical protein